MDVKKVGELWIGEGKGVVDMETAKGFGTLTRCFSFQRIFLAARDPKFLHLASMSVDGFCFGTLSSASFDIRSLDNS